MATIRSWTASTKVAEDHGVPRRTTSSSIRARSRMALRVERPSTAISPATAPKPSSPPLSATTAIPPIRAGGPALRIRAAERPLRKATSRTTSTAAPARRAPTSKVRRAWAASRGAGG